MSLSYNLLNNSSAKRQEQEGHDRKRFVSTLEGQWVSSDPKRVSQCEFRHCRRLSREALSTVSTHEACSMFRHRGRNRCCVKQPHPWSTIVVLARWVGHTTSQQLNFWNGRPQLTVTTNIENLSMHLLHFGGIYLLQFPTFGHSPRSWDSTTEIVVALWILISAVYSGLIHDVLCPACASFHKQLQATHVFQPTGASADRARLHLSLSCFRALPRMCLVEGIRSHATPSLVSAYWERASHRTRR